MSLLPEKKVSCGGYLHFVFPIGEGLKSRGSDDSIHPFWFDISSIHEQRVAGKKKLYAALFEAKGGGRAPRKTCTYFCNVDKCCMLLIPSWRIAAARFVTRAEKQHENGFFCPFWNKKTWQRSILADGFSYRRSKVHTNETRRKEPSLLFQNVCKLISSGQKRRIDGQCRYPRVRPRQDSVNGGYAS